MRPLTARVFAVLSVVLSNRLAAQEPELQPRSGYGDDLQVVVVPFTRFVGLGTSSTYYSACCFLGLAGERWASDDILMAEIDAGLVPNGADLEQISFYVLDTDGGANVNFDGRICRSWVDVDGDNLDGDCPFDVNTFGAPGQTVVGGDPNLQIRYQFDVDNDGTEEVVHHMLWAGFPDGNLSGAIRLRSVRLQFRRQVSPAPVSATFGDVPTGHPFFQFVEALAASGITAGCGSGNYCPDAPLTRGQMAVFLAKALGLHWPAPSAPQ